MKVNVINDRIDETISSTNNNAKEKQHQDNNIIMYPVGTCSIVGGSVLSGIDERRFSNNARLNKV